VDRRENTTPWPEGTRVDERCMKVIFTLNEVVFERAFIWRVCGTCGGKGRHVNPSIDADHGITAEEFADDPDFAEDYFGGVYDVTCHECGGKRVVPELRDPCPELDAYRDDEYDHRALCRAERMMGA
jgi:hypothetical protein